MLKHYCIWQFKKWLPLAGIFTGVLATVFGYSCLTEPTYYVDNPSYSYTSMSGPSLLSFYIVAIVLSFVASVFVFHYRTSRQSVDTYYQAAYGPTTIKRARMLLGLAILLISIIASYVLCLGFYLIRYFSTPEVQETIVSGTTVTYYRVPLTGWIYPVYLLIAIVVVSSQYFINCFLTGMGDYVFDQICLLLFGNIALALTVVSPALYVIALARGNVPADAAYSLFYGFSCIGPGILTGFINAQAWNTDAFNHAIGSTAMTVVLGIVCCVANLFIRDPSGECANVRGARNKSIAMVPHAAALTIGIVIACCGIFPSTTIYHFNALPLFLYILFTIIYYAALALWRHSFKPSKQDIISYACVCGATFVMLFACYARYLTAA